MLAVSLALAACKEQAAPIAVARAEPAAAQLPLGHPPIGVTAAAPDSGSIKVAKAPSPSGRTVAKPASRSTLRCCDTPGWEIPNSAWMTAHTAPEVISPSASSSRIRRRTGSPSTSKACTGSEYQCQLI